jgi:DNA polymerase epsilon subunit 1
MPKVSGNVPTGLAAHQKSGHPHVCLWGINGVCSGGDFATREELNRHVKIEHLLECPVTGCTEKAFQNRDLLATHMGWDHRNNGTVKPTSNLMGGTITSLQDVPGAPPTGKAVTNKRDCTEDRVLKMEMSIGIFKKRCREQLRTVLEKRLRRANGKLRINEVD